MPVDGQRWTTPEGVLDGRSSDVREHEPGLTGIGLAPSFAIGQRMLLVETDGGERPLGHDPGGRRRGCRGGAGARRCRAIAISHPHYYGAASAWSEALGGVPVLLHAADAEWVTRPDAAIEHWEGDVRELPGGLTLLRLGGHFPGATVLHWPGGADGRGVLLSGDVVMALPDRNVSFMWSYPNLVPLPAARWSGSARRSSRGRSSGSTAPGGTASCRRTRRTPCAAASPATRAALRGELPL